MLPEALDTVLFDAGGTLVRIDYEFMAGVARDQGVALDVARLPHGEALARKTIDARFAGGDHPDDSDAARVPSYFETVLRGSGIGIEDARRLAAAIEAAHWEDNLWRVPFPDAAPTLARLQDAGLRLAVVSNADGRARQVLEEAGLLPWLDFVLDSSEEGVEKPDPEIFERALARGATVAQRAIYVGDIYEIDVVGARAAGVTPCLLDPTGSYADVDCLRFASLTELLDRVLAGR